MMLGHDYNCLSKVAYGVLTFTPTLPISGIAPAQVRKGVFYLVQTHIE